MAEAYAKPPTSAGTSSDLTGSTVGRFAIRARLGKGGMGEVYRAHDTKLKRPVALKRIAPEHRTDEEYRSRLWKEAERASRLSYAHIAGVYDVLEEKGEIFLVMEYVEGQTLRERLRDPLPPEEFLRLAVQCAEALAAAHEKEVVHRDIKPENIMLTPTGLVKILDFGVAKRLLRHDPEGPTTDASSLMVGTRSGTPAYMAPETLLEREIDERVDIFSLGVVFYEALTGSHPFRGANYEETTARILREVPPPVSRHNSTAPAELDRIVAKMLAKDPAQRYATARDLLGELRAVRSALVSPWKQLLEHLGQWWRYRTRWERAALAAGVALAALLVGVLAYQNFRIRVFAERDWILVADFDNQSGELLFDHTASELVRHALQQSRYVNVVPRSRVVDALRRMGRTQVMHVDAALGREICRRENFRALLTGKIISAGSAFQIILQILDPWQGLPVVTETERLESPAELYAGVDRLTQRLRRHLGESLAQVEKDSTALAQVTTSSLVALERYSRALELYAAGDFERFLVLANSAVEHDPNFVMAHLYLARAHYRLGDDKSALEHMARTEQAQGRVTERERYLILATHNQFQGEYEKAVEQYRLLTELYPDDLQGHRGLAEVSIYVGQREEAIEAQRRVLELDPHSAFDHSRLLLYLSRVNRFREALAAYKQARAQDISGAQLHWGAGLAHLGLGNPEEARAEFELLAAEGGTYEENLASLYLARVLMYEGRMREAAEVLRAGFALDERLGSETWIPVRRYLLARVELVRGRAAAARAEARRLALDARAELQPANLLRAAFLALELGELGSARQLLALLDELRTQQDSTFTKACYHILRGELERVAGRAEAAVESQRAATLFSSSFESFLALGKAYRARGDWRSAIQAYERFLGFKGEILRDDFPGGWVLGHLYLARLFSQIDDTQQALRHYDEFLRLWAGADSDLPVLELARAERERLVTLRSNSSGLKSIPTGVKP
ncbi:MAG: protein kinase [Terriglobia bacterium]